MFTLLASILLLLFYFAYLSQYPTAGPMQVLFGIALALTLIGFNILVADQSWAIRNLKAEVHTLTYTEIHSKTGQADGPTQTNAERN